MHPFPPAAELQFLVGEEISQICLDPYGLQFRFVMGAQISAEGLVEHVDKQGQSRCHDCQAQTPAALYLHQLLQRRVVKVDAEPYCLSLTFDDGAILRVFGEEGRYERGNISAPGQSMIVF